MIRVNLIHKDPRARFRQENERSHRRLMSAWMRAERRGDRERARELDDELRAINVAFYARMRTANRLFEAIWKPARDRALARIVGLL